MPGDLPAVRPLAEIDIGDHATKGLSLCLSKMVSAWEPAFRDFKFKARVSKGFFQERNYAFLVLHQKEALLVCISDLHFHAYSDYQRVGVFYERVLDIAQD